MRKILISNPSSMYITFLPYLHGVLKLHAEADPEIARNYQWLKPLYLHETPEFLLAGYNLSEIDVLGLSCYVWNFSIQIEIAKRVKKANPGCLVIVGGPEPDWADPRFFERYPEIDIVVTHDGEIPFSRILKARLQGAEAQYDDIPGVITLKEGVLHKGPPSEKPMSWPEKSPYCDDPQMKEILKEHSPGQSLAVIWETNRGCPYSCVFCDWGSYVNSKIRVFPEEKIRREIQWFAENKIERVYIADANFGILARDEAIIDELVALKKLTGWPKVVDWCAAKNSIERVTRICIKLHEAQLNRGVLIGYQSTDANVLEAMSRVNMSELKHRQMVETLQKAGVHIFAAIIIGSPEDTKQSFQKTLHDLLELGFEDSIRSYLYALLPNAPANSKNYKEKHKILTKRRKIVGPVLSNTELDSPYFPRIDYLVGHAKMNRQDWIDHCRYYAFISGLHNLGLTRYVALFARSHLKMSFADFYPRLFEAFLARPETQLGRCLKDLENHLTRFQEDPDSDFFIRSDEDQTLYELEKWLFVKMIENKRIFFHELEDELRNWFPDYPLLSDLIRFQAFSIFPMNSDFSTTATFNENWVRVLSEETTPLSPSFESKPTVISLDFDPAKKYSWLAHPDPRNRRLGYVRDILGSMIYKNTLSLIRLESMTPEIIAQMSCRI